MKRKRMMIIVIEVMKLDLVELGLFPLSHLENVLNDGVWNRLGSVYCRMYWKEFEKEKKLKKYEL